MQDTHGVRRRARLHSLIRNRRDPSWRPTLGEGGSYKLMAKWNRAGRESEGSIVPLTPTERPDEGRGPALVVPEPEGKHGAWSQDPITPFEKCENFTTGCTSPPNASRNRMLVLLLENQQSDDLLASRLVSTMDACTRLVKTIGKPDAGNPHVRFERGPQETEPVRNRA
jgi:hypothetical protein